MTPEFVRQRIVVTQELIVAYEDALLALASDQGMTSYTINTSQSVQTVTRSDVRTLQATLDGLYNRLATLQARLTGSTIIARPAF